MTLSEYAAAMEKSGRPGDAAVARYIQTHRARLGAWLREYTNGRGRADREELLQVMLLACVEAVRAPDAETGINNVRNAMARQSRAAGQWERRRTAAAVAEEGLKDNEVRLNEGGEN